MNLSAFGSAWDAARAGREPFVLIDGRVGPGAAWAGWPASGR